LVIAGDKIFWGLLIGTTMSGTTPIYRGYDERGLRAQYLTREAVPDYERYFAHWAATSDTARRTLRQCLNISYGAGGDDRLDIFMPETGRLFPVQVFFHGGYWRALGKDDFSGIALALVPAGAVVVIVEYTLCPRVNLDELVEQCRRAVAWTADNIASFGGDPSRLYVSGHSAGGHITAMMTATDWTSHGNAKVKLGGACAVSGLFDLEPIALASFLQSDLRLTPDQVLRNSPLRLIAPSAVPLILSVGENETSEFHRQSSSYAKAWRAAGNRVDEVRAAGRHHYSIIDSLLDEGDPLCRALLRQMGLAA
jgi:arylformamidase